MQEANIYQTVGLLRANWYNEKKQLVVFNYGTAFAFSDRILLTCTHNIFSEKTNSYASEILFIPNISQAAITSRTRVYRSCKGEYYKSLVPKTLANKQPVKEELALIVLEQSLEVDSYLKVGSIEDQEVANQIKIVGYPSQNYMSSITINNIRVKRHQSSGKLYGQKYQDSHILSYTVQTSIGVSGSAVLLKLADGSFKIVGIHTHRGLTRNYNSGLYFNEEILQNLKKWKAELEEEFNLQKSAVLYQRCWHAIYQGLTQQNSAMSQVSSYDEQFQNKSSISSGEYDLFEQDFPEIQMAQRQTKATFFSQLTTQQA